MSWTARSVLSKWSAIFMAGFLVATMAMACPGTNCPCVPGKEEPVISAQALGQLKAELVKKHGDKEKARVERGLDQMAGLWRKIDGDAAAFSSFARENFVPEGEQLDKTLGRFETGLEQLWGHLNEVGRELRRWSDLDLGPLLPIDKIFAAWDVTAHAIDDMFQNKAAFIVLLNFPVTKLEQRVNEGPKWTRRQWAEARLAAAFSKRIPADVNLEVTKASADGDLYISEYNVWMHHLLDEKGQRLFPSGLRLISHWNLRDELKAAFSESNGLPKQKMIAKVMERIVLQEIPQAVINNPRVDWCPYTNEVKPAPKDSIEADAPPVKDEPAKDALAKAEPDTRYQHLLNTFKAVRRADPFCPAVPTLIARRFEEGRELPEARVEQLLKDVATSPLVARTAERISKKLGRKLEPFDVWYNGFQSRGKYKEADLDAAVAKKYPNVAAFKADLPRILADLGFSAQRAKYLTERIEVDPSRGAGHAMGAQRKGDLAHLRTRFGGKNGAMDFKGFNIAIHEFGHNVEQTFSLNNVDRYLLQGVPNTAFTEAIAFVFQARDTELLGLGKPDAEAERLRVINDFWMTFEIAGPALVDITVWHWMYDHPNATPAELKAAVVQISKDIWNKYYEPVLGAKDCVLLGIYSHMISLMMYLPDYPLGHLIAFQIEEKLKESKSFGDEIERMTSFGCVTPDLWMQNATGKPVSAQPLLKAAEAALAQ